MAKQASDLVLWADEWLLAVNKPAGLPSLPDGYDPHAPFLGSLLQPEFGRLWMVHRLDRETSGVIVLARTPEAHRALNTQFERRQVRKIYHALAVGGPDWQEKLVRLPLRPDGDRRHRTVVDPRRGKPSQTQVRVLERFLRHTLLEAEPHSGRTHQIRVHLAAIGLPLVADDLYGDGQSLYLSQFKPDYRGQRGTERALIERAALHARSLSLLHPATGQELRLEAPYPKDLAGALRQLRRYQYC